LLALLPEHEQAALRKLHAAWAAADAAPTLHPLLVGGMGIIPNKESGRLQESVAFVATKRYPHPWSRDAEEARVAEASPTRLPPSPGLRGGLLADPKSTHVVSSRPARSSHTSTKVKLDLAELKAFSQRQAQAGRAGAELYPPSSSRHLREKKPPVEQRVRALSQLVKSCAAVEPDEEPPDDNLYRLAYGCFPRSRQQIRPATALRPSLSARAEPPVSSFEQRRRLVSQQRLLRDMQKQTLQAGFLLQRSRAPGDGSLAGWGRLDLHAPLAPMEP
jgi:hypothetical protein